MADFTPSVIFLLSQHPISQPDTTQNKIQKTALTKSPPTPSQNVVTLHSISVNSQRSTVNGRHAALTSNL